MDSPSQRRPSHISRVRLYGDKARAQEIARLHLNRLWVAFRRLCSFQNLQQNMQRVDFAEGPYKGGFALLKKTFGEESAEIFVPQTGQSRQTRRPVESKTVESHTWTPAYSLYLSGQVRWRYVYSDGNVPSSPVLTPWVYLSSWETTVPGGETRVEEGFITHVTRYADGPDAGGTQKTQSYLLLGGVEVGFPYVPQFTQTFAYSEDYEYDFYVGLLLEMEPASASGGWHLNYSGEGLYNIGIYNDVLVENPQYHIVVYQKFEVAGQASQDATLAVNPLNGDTASPSRGPVTATETKTHTQVLVINGQTILSVPESEGKVSAKAVHHRGFAPVQTPAETETSVSYLGDDEITTIRTQFKSEASQSDEILTAYAYGVALGDGEFVWKRYGCMIGTTIADDVGESDAGEWRPVGDFEWHPGLFKFRAPGLVTRLTQIIKKPEQEV